MRLRIGLSLLLPVLLLAVLGPILLIDPQYSDLPHRNAPPFADWAHPLGTDLLGRDTLARLAHGLRLTLITGMLSLLVAQAIGGLLGFAILAKQPNFAPIIVKAISQIMALLWIVTMSIFLFATLTDGTDTLEWTLGLITHLIVFGAAILLLVLRKKAFLLPEVPERTRWTGMGWRVIRLLLATPILTACIMLVTLRQDPIYQMIPITLYIGTSIGLVIAPFTLRTTLAAGQTSSVPSDRPWTVLGTGMGTARLQLS